MKSLTKIRYNKSQRIGIVVLVALLFLVELGIWFIGSKKQSNQITEIPQEIIALQNQIDGAESSNTYSDYKSNQKELGKFNPNSLDKEGWTNLGFSPKQAAVILKYKNSLGGNFTSKQEIKECFVISEEKFNELLPYILLPEYSLEKTTINQNNSNYYTAKSKINYKKFNPNDYTENDWIKIGFSPKQSKTILKYKRSLGGNFTSLEQIRNCFVISEDKFNEMKPFIYFPKPELIQKTKTPENPQPITKKLQKFNPNDLTKEQWKELGFSDKQVNTIFNYKSSLGGKFKDAAILKKCYSISEEKFREIEPYLIFDSFTK